MTSKDRLSRGELRTALLLIGNIAGFLVAVTVGIVLTLTAQWVGGNAAFLVGAGFGWAALCILWADWSA